MTGPLVTAIVSTYKSERFIRGCLEDLEAQTIADRLEIVVIDSGSPENEGAIVEEFRRSHDNIVYVRTERESVYQAWNRGIALARGTYLTNANTDDRHRPDAYARLAAALDANPAAAVAYADCAVTITPGLAYDAAPRIGRFAWPDFDRNRLFRTNFIGPQPMWRRSLHGRHGGFDPAFITAGDYEFWLRLAGTEAFVHLPEVLGVYLMSPDSIEHRNRGKDRDEAALARERHWQTAWGERPAPGGFYLRWDWAGLLGRALTGDFGAFRLIARSIF